MSLIELIVAMGIFTIFLAIFMSAVIGLTRGTTKAQLTADSASGMLLVFQSMDRQVRYADAINFPGNGPSGARYFEFRTPAHSAADGVAMCTQWRFDPATGYIESRGWQEATPAAKTSWGTKLTSAIAPAVSTPDYPFKLTKAVSGGPEKQQLTLTLRAGNADLDAASETSTTFVARNSRPESLGNKDANNDGVSDNPVCLTAGARP